MADINPSNWQSSRVIRSHTTPMPGGGGENLVHVTMKYREHNGQIGTATAEFTSTELAELARDRNLLRGYVNESQIREHSGQSSFGEGEGSRGSEGGGGGREQSRSRSLGRTRRV